MKRNSYRKSKKNIKVKDFGATNNKVVIIAAVIAALVIIYILFGIYFNNHFYIRSSVNGVGTSFKSAESAYEAVIDCASEYELSFIDESGEVVKTLTADDLGVRVDYEKQDIEDLLVHQNGFLWPVKIFTGEKFSTPSGNTYDENAVKKAAKSLTFLYKKDGTKSENAKIVFNGKEFEIQPEVEGTLITKASCEKAIVNAIDNFLTELNIANGDCAVKPTVTKDDPRLETALRQLEGYMDTDIHYDLGEGLSDEIPADIKSTFFVINDKCRVSFDEKAIGDFVNQMSEKYNTFGKPKELVSTSGEQVSVPCGAYGWKIGYQAEIDAIVKDLKAGKDVTRDFNYMYTANSHGEHDYGDNFVEVNLTDQMVYIHKGGAVVFESPCVSGNISAGHGTHTGTYPIAYKEKDATLRGANYESHVKYWMPFNMGEGLHDASWRSSFGGHLFMTSGSHGCVNLPTSAAKKIFEIVDAGWPVLVFYVGNTEAEIYAKNNPVSRVETEISDIETVTLDSAVALLNARADYEALSDEQKAQVMNLDVLEAAELQYQVLLMENGQQAPPQPEVEITQE